MKRKETPIVIQYIVHLGYYKASLVVDREKYTKEKLDPSYFIWKMIYLIIYTAIKIGLPRDKTINQIVIGKIPENNNINKL